MQAAACLAARFRGIVARLRVRGRRRGGALHCRPLHVQARPTGALAFTTGGERDPLQVAPHRDRQAASVGHRRDRRPAAARPCQAATGKDSGDFRGATHPLRAGRPQRSGQTAGVVDPERQYHGIVRGSQGGQVAGRDRLCVTHRDVAHGRRKLGFDRGGRRAGSAGDDDRSARLGQGAPDASAQPAGPLQQRHAAALAGQLLGSGDPCKAAAHHRHRAPSLGWPPPSRRRCRQRHTRSLDRPDHECVAVLAAQTDGPAGLIAGQGHRNRQRHCRAHQGQRLREAAVGNGAHHAAHVEVRRAGRRAGRRAVLHATVFERAQLSLVHAAPAPPSLHWARSPANTLSGRAGRCVIRTPQAS